METLPVPLEDLPFRVVARHRRTPVITEVVLEPADQRLEFRPGQYVLLGDEDYRLPVRSYSVANAPRRSGRISLLVTRVPGGQTSEWVHDRLAVGDQVLVSGPYGTFVGDPRSGRPVLCLAGGSGIAPIRALAEDAAGHGFPRPFTVGFSARTVADLLDVDLFAGWQWRFPRFRYVRTLTRQSDRPPTGPLPDLMEQLFGRLDETQVFVAGAPGFVASVAREARRLGAAAGRLHTEEFFADPEPWTALAGGTR